MNFQEMGWIHLGRKAFYVLILSGASVVAHAGSASIPASDQIEKQGTELLLAHDFNGYERSADNYRNSMAVTSDGYLRLQMLYGAVGDICPSKPNDPCWEAFSKATQKWLVSNNKSTAAVIVSSKFALLYGQTIRGQETAATTPNQAMLRFENYVADAKAILDAGRQVASNDPAWYELQIQAANFQGADKKVVLDLARKGLKIAPNFFGIHMSAFDALTPRWGGSVALINQLLQIADQSLGPSRPREYYGRLAYRIVIGYGTNELVADGFDWPPIKQSYDEIIKKYPVNSNFNRYAAMACAAGDIPTLKTLFARIGTAVNPNDWFHKPELIGECRNIAAKS